MNKATRHTLISCGICLATVLLYLIFYSRLPDMIPLHWNLQGQANNYLPKPFAAVGLPLFFTVINLFVILRRKDSATWRYYIVPLISIIAAVVTLTLSLK